MTVASIRYKEATPQLQYILYIHAYTYEHETSACQATPMFPLYGAVQ